MDSSAGPPPVRRPRRRPRSQHADRCAERTWSWSAPASRVWPRRSAVAASGRSVIVLEARRRVGGRVLNHRFGGGEIVEIGGQWVGPTQDKLLALADDLGVETLPTYNDGQQRLLPGRHADALRVQRPARADPAGPGRRARGVRRHRSSSTRWRPRCRATRRGPPHAPRSTTARPSRPGSRPTSSRPAGASCSTSASRPSGPPSRATSRCCTSSSTSTPPATRTRRGPSTGSSTPRAARRSRASSAARSWSPGGWRAGSAGASCSARRCGSLEQSGGRVRAVCDKVTVSAKQAIVAVPPAVAASDPLRPGPARRRARSCCSGSRWARWSSAWRSTPSRSGAADGLTGQATSDTGPVKITFDNTPARRPRRASCSASSRARRRASGRAGRRPSAARR